MIRVRLVSKPGRTLPRTAADFIRKTDKAVFHPQDVKVVLENGIWWVAYDGKKSVGYGGMRWLNGRVVEFVRAGVVPGYRGRGIHKKLIQARIRYAARMGATSVVTYTVRNLPSSNALISCGFRHYAPRWRSKDHYHYLRVDLKGGHVRTARRTCKKTRHRAAKRHLRNTRRRSTPRLRGSRRRYSNKKVFRRSSRWRRR